ncbi:MAG: Fic family protein [Polaribacter sp.]|jgi:Fic family protein
MNLFNPELIQANGSKLLKIDSEAKKILRNVIFCRKTSSRNLLDNFISSTNNLTDWLSIKNAQMEAQNEDEAKLYLKNLKKATFFVTEEIKRGVVFDNPMQLFELFRLIAPESHQLHPNRFRDKLVQVGSHICPDPKMLRGLVNNLFSNMKVISNPITRAVYFHHELIRIHPFIDGNGRVTRIAKNWMLMFELYPPIFISNKTEKRNYVESLSNSFIAIRENEKIWNNETNIFFEQELDRLLKNILYVKNNLNPIIK